jgi:hypothetical protein
MRQLKITITLVLAAMFLALAQTNAAPNATVVVTGLKPVIDTWTLAADGRTLTHDADDHKVIYVYERH